MSSFIFPEWTNGLRVSLALGGGFAALYAAGIVYFGFSPLATDVGYMPTQPIPYNHALHAGILGLDCTYCHATVDESPHAAVPPTQVCMNCHTGIKRESAEPAKSRIAAISAAYAASEAIKWVKVHDLPDYAYFNHSAHVRRGIGCASCHGRVDQMDVVYQAQPLSMGWCLECHREPERFLRPLDKITDMAYALTPEEQLRVGRELRQKYNINPSQDCSTCHR
ncbi:MAG: cytochrome c3 family protein [Phycisphaerae bacterium]|nr:cytochrome c3 family protein [Phycisphaerae bacterium]NUQ48457.1 cytochrome c3 family protein [Phycisphaerae bacterium]